MRLMSRPAAGSERAPRADRRVPPPPAPSFEDPNRLRDEFVCLATAVEGPRSARHGEDLTIAHSWRRRYRPPSSSSPSTAPTSLDRTLASLHQVRYRNFEVLVVDGPRSTIRRRSSRHANFVRPFSTRSRQHLRRAQHRHRARQGRRRRLHRRRRDPRARLARPSARALRRPQVVAVGGFISGPDRVRISVAIHASAIATAMRAIPTTRRSSRSTTRHSSASPEPTSRPAARIYIAIGGYDEEYICSSTRPTSISACTIAAGNSSSRRTRRSITSSRPG